MTDRARAAAAWIALVVVLPAPACAQMFPARPIRLLVGFPPGGAVDVIGRTLGPRLTEAFGQQIVVDNRAGATTRIACELTARAAPDGYTLFMQDISAHAINAGLFARLPFDPVTDFTAVILVASAPLVLVAYPGFPASTIAELVEAARARPGAIDFASGGIGSSTHLSGELLKLMANVKLNHVPYKGGALAMPDVISGQMPLLFFSLPGALPQIRAGRVKAIAVTSGARSGSAPEIPTIAESGVPGYDATAGFGVPAPKAVPRRIVDRLNGEILQALHNAEVASTIQRQGADPRGSTPEELQTFLIAEIAKWGKVIRAADLRPE